MKITIEIDRNEFNAVQDTIGQLSDGEAKVKLDEITVTYPGLIASTTVKEDKSSIFEFNINSNAIMQCLVFIGGLGTYVKNFLINLTKDFFATCTYTNKTTGETRTTSINDEQE